MESTLTCKLCSRPLDLSYFRKQGRPRLDGQGLHEVCIECRRGESFDTETDWCALCEVELPNLDALAEHMRKDHKRLILDQDINKQTADRQARFRALQEEALVA